MSGAAAAACCRGICTSVIQVTPLIRLADDGRPLSSLPPPPPPVLNA
jgi:hypothetical protein